jgi:hypothetical protein
VRASTFESAPSLFAADLPAPGPLATVGGLVFWGDDGGLWSKPSNVPDGGITGFGDLSAPVAITSSGSVLYWVNAGGTVRQMDGTNPGTPRITAETVDAGVMSLGAISKSNRSFVYICQLSQGLGLYEVMPDGTAKTLNPLKMPDCRAIFVTGMHVYAVDLGRADVAVRNRGELWRTELDGSGRVMLATGLVGSPGLTVSGDFVYFGDRGAIVRTTK